MLDVVSVDVGARARSAACRRARAVVHAARAPRSDSAARHPVAVRRSARDRPGAPRQAQDRLRGLAQLHPADIADIVEDLPPAEREAVFETIDEEVAAETLEELDPDVKVAIVESLDKDRAADIVEEMDPDAAADLLGDLPEEHSGEILKEMQPEERRRSRSSSSSANTPRPDG
jgi:hypothetical protein